MAKKKVIKAVDKVISIKEAKVNNLKNVSIDIPHYSLTVISGISGSGKSSLAFDTLYAEGQRRFVESLSSYARQFLEKMDKPDVASISGLPPAIAIEQKTHIKNSRSTVGTTTEIYDYLRLIYGRIGKTVCIKCGQTISKDTPDSIVASISNFDEGDKLYILFSLDFHNDLNTEIQKAVSQGFSRVVIDDSDDIININDEELPKNITIERIAFVADRLVYRQDSESVSRMKDSVESALRLGEGRITIKNLTKKITRKFSTKYECADCDIIYQEPEPKLFSFNNPYGACPHCQGFGRTMGIDEDLVIPDKNLSIVQGAIHPFRGPSFAAFFRKLLKAAEKHKIPVDQPFHFLSPAQVKYLWEGGKSYDGINGFFKHLEEHTNKIFNRITYSRYRGYTKCKHCGGSRLRTSARQTFVAGKNIPEIIEMPLNKVSDFFNKLTLTAYEEKVVGLVLEEIKSRLTLLIDIGLEYLTLNRLSHTLSGGEAQRINLATSLGASLVGTLYVLDEPSIGMHQVDTERLLKILFKLRNLGNTIVVVEHDLDIIRKADFMIDMGPKAGEKGGEIVASGTVKDIMKNPASITGQYLTGKKKIDFEVLKQPDVIKIASLVRNYDDEGNSKQLSLFDEKISKISEQINDKLRAKLKNEIEPENRVLDKLYIPKITIHKPRENNLKIDKVSFPIGYMTVVTGVSGSGKSTLINDVLYQGLRRIKSGLEAQTANYEKIDGSDYFDFIEMVDQTPIGKSTRSTPITYTKAYDYIRELFASTQAAKQLGWKVGHFSFNVPGGRCDACEGEGYVSVDMQFLPNVHLLCDVCKGTRFKKEARMITFKDKSIIDVLEMTITEAIDFFMHIPKIARKLQVMEDVGLGYLRLGQSSNLLSGGESQRIKLAHHLENSKSARTLFIFDEPTTGLHIDDISKLLICFRRLIQNQQTVIIIEHNMHVIASADWIIDLGPGAGDKGGKIIATGNPKKIATVENSATGKALREFYDTENIEY